MGFDYDRDFERLFGNGLKDACDYDNDGKISETEYRMAEELFFESSRRQGSYGSYESENEEPEESEESVFYYNAPSVTPEHDAPRSSTHQQITVTIPEKEYRSRRSQLIFRIVLAISGPLFITVLGAFCFSSVAAEEANTDILAVLVVFGLGIYGAVKLWSTVASIIVDSAKEIKSINNALSQLPKKESIIKHKILLFGAFSLVVLIPILFANIDNCDREEPESKKVSSVYVIEDTKPTKYHETTKTNAPHKLIDAPFVGMDESRVFHTSLGQPDSKVRHNNECIGGLQYKANLYDFKKNGKVIFTARCVRGKVTNIWDKRDTEPSTRYTTKKTTSTKSDPYDVNDYYFPEDFYYDHYDDFFDYEDAEDYFYDHQ